MSLELDRRKLRPRTSDQREIMSTVKIVARTCFALAFQLSIQLIQADGFRVTAKCESWLGSYQVLERLIGVPLGRVKFSTTNAI